jgi:hypothetical protein
MNQNNNQEQNNSSIPKSFVIRNEYGLINNESIKYQYTPEGLVDWRRMINPKHLVPNKQNFEKFGKPIPKSIEGLEDKDLLILLAGIKELAQIRGFQSVEYQINSPAGDYIAAVCRITWIPNFETENKIVTFSAIGDASPFNTTSFGKNFLGPMAENRAFVRCVRNFLKINITGQDEMAPSASEQVVEDTSSNVLEELMKKHGVTFQKVKEKLIEEKFDKADSFESVSDIPKFKQFELIERIKKKVNKK